MKKKLFLVVIVLMPVLGVAQNLTVSDLVRLRPLDVGKAEDFMSKKKWEIVSIEKTSGKECKEIGFAY